MHSSSLLIDLSDHARRLGVRFSDLGLLQRALTHRSFVNEHPEAGLEDNERLEFLGDAVIDFIAAGWLYVRFPAMDEGTLTRLRAGLVRNETLARLSTTLGLGSLMLFGKGEEDGGGRRRASNLGSAFEALVGAMYLDQGLEAARTFVEPRFAPVLDHIMREQSDKDAKSRLQEWTQATLNITPLYRVAAIEGPEHLRQFTVEVLIANEVWGRGQGRSKRIAAQEAASAALDGRQQRGYAV
jgi:ribonuclease-3